MLKPNLIDYDPDRPLNTHPAMIAAAISALRQLGAQEVIVAEGSGHNRDMEMILEQTGVDQVLRDEKVRFVDLNSDAISPVPLVSNYTKLSQFFFPNTILGADLVVSMPKLKTHHWAGATLSLKNLFGTIPGVKYGWPKNYPALVWHLQKHCGYFDNHQSWFCHCGWNRWHGRRRSLKRYSSKF